MTQKLTDEQLKERENEYKAAIEQVEHMVDSVRDATLPFFLMANDSDAGRVFKRIKSMYDLSCRIIEQKKKFDKR